MVVLITKQNEGFFSRFNPKFKFTESTVNTSTFRITEKKFIELRNWVRGQGVNPYAVMSW